LRGSSRDTAKVPSRYTFGNGIVPLGDFTLPSGIVIHDYQVEGLEGRFQLTETFNFLPIANPEPVAIIPFSTSLLGVLGFTWWKRRRSSAGTYPGSSDFP
jgi:hypothetical protein